LKNKRYIIGVDVGGTNIKLGIIDLRGRIQFRSSFETKYYIRNKKQLIQALTEGIQALVNQADITKRDILGVGIGLPGLIDPVNGIVKFLPNIPGWKNVPLARIIAPVLHLPVIIENDVNLIALAEWKYGSGAGARNMICITLGTGVGGGLILKNQLYRGEGYVAGELGHIPIEEDGPACNCGGWGCLEREVGNRYLQAKAARIFRKPDITLEEVCALAQAGHPKARKLWQDTAVHIGNALTGVVNLLNPTRIVIGGGVANASRFMFKTMEQTIKRRAMRVQGQMVKIVKARLGSDAGIIGAQVLVTDVLKGKKII